jgi:hypothetical protein
VLSGTILVDGGVPSPDEGAIILAWPVGFDQPAKTNAVQVLQYLNAGEQSPYNDKLITAKADSQGRFRMRMHEYDEFHVMVLSEKLQTRQPKTWGDAIDELKAQVEDPPTLIGNRIYHYEKISMPSDKQATVDFTFTPE